MSTIIERYISENNSSIAAATAFMTDLMADDPNNFKQGYTADNALIATHEVFGDLLDESQWTIVAKMKNANRSRLHAGRRSPADRQRRDV